MSTTLTLKNIPDDIYARLKLSAQLHHRSLNGEAIVCLEKALLPAKLTVDNRIARAQALRSALMPVKQVKLKAREIDALKRVGRA